MATALSSKTAATDIPTTIQKIEAGTIFVTEVGENGLEKKKQVLLFKHRMMLQGLKAVDGLLGIIKLLIPGGMLLVVEHQRNLASNRDRKRLFREPVASGSQGGNIRGWKTEGPAGFLFRDAQSRI